jgi:hypothetical protein
MFAEPDHGLPSLDVLYRSSLIETCIARYNDMVHPEPLTGRCDALFCHTADGAELTLA